MTEYRFVGLENPFMKVAYNVAKSFYKLKDWNAKIAPICVITSRDRIVSVGIAGNGMHQMTGACQEGICEWCQPHQHAEILGAEKMTENAKFGSAYLYGYFKMCDPCIAALEKKGIKDLVLMGKSTILFNMNNPQNVIGTPNQFNSE